jgi:hypothetical protein
LGEKIEEELFPDYMTYYPVRIGEVLRDRYQIVGTRFRVETPTHLALLKTMRRFTNRYAGVVGTWH